MTTSLDTEQCQRCGANLRLEDLYCANCGAPVPEYRPRSTPEPRAAKPDGRPVRRNRGAAPWSEPDAWTERPSWQERTSVPEPTWWEEPPSQRTLGRYGRTSGGTDLATPPISDGSRLWAAAAPLGIIAGAVLSAGLLSFVIPLIIWQVRKGTDEFASGYGRESLNAMLSLVVYALIGLVIAIPLTIITLGLGLIVMAFAAGVVALVFLISLVLATIRALNSQPFRYPLMIRFFK